MYISYAILNGLLIAFMVTFNGLLATRLGNDKALIAIHVIGLMGSIILLFISKSKLKSIKGLPVYLFFAGALGIFNVTFNNLSFAALGATLTLSLNLIGQLVTSTIFDNFGLLGLSVNKVNKTKLSGIAIMLIGIATMVFL